MEEQGLQIFQTTFTKATHFNFVYSLDFCSALFVQLSGKSKLFNFFAIKSNVICPLNVRFERVKNIELVQNI